MSADDKEMSRSLKRSPDIDWSKPVEYDDGDDSWLPVVFSVEDRNCSRLCVVLDPFGDHDSVRFDRATRNRFRNVRRKCEAWLVLYADGMIGTFYKDKNGAAQAARECEAELRHIEWEADADE